ncbi:hypothetical protein ACWET9_16525 [Streptomyces sp. NPDC004059]
MTGRLSEGGLVLVEVQAPPVGEAVTADKVRVATAADPVGEAVVVGSAGAVAVPGEACAAVGAQAARTTVAAG